MARPLAGIRVLDFSTLLPGPMATLILADAGAEVIKIERPGRGDEMRGYVPKFGGDSVNFALLNRGKRSIALDLKDPAAIAAIHALVREADIVIEQFRPGVMERLGLGFDALCAINPRLIYCSITGYGQSGPNAATAAHDLNFVAESGMLSLSAGADGAPVLPPALIADIAGGTYPALLNILLALRQRDLDGQPRRLDISMSDNLFTFMYWALGNGQVAGGQWPRPGGELVTGGSPRYQIYRTRDQRFIAAAPLEDKFWNNFLDAIGAPSAWIDDSRDPEGIKQGLTKLFGAHDADHWMARLQGKDVCCSLVASVEEAMQAPQFRQRGLFARRLHEDGGSAIAALPLPLEQQFRDLDLEAGYPPLGEANREFGLDPQT